MLNNLYNILRLLRPRQWVKNFAIFAAIVFAGQLFNQIVLQPVILGFLIFCMISSATYIINDIFDRENDRRHPFKKFRRLAHGDVNVTFAALLAGIFILTGLILATIINFTFFLSIILYLVIQISYSACLKTIT